MNPSKFLPTLVCLHVCNNIRLVSIIFFSFSYLSEPVPARSQDSQGSDSSNNHPIIFLRKTETHLRYNFSFLLLLNFFLVLSTVDPVCLSISESAGIV